MVENDILSDHADWAVIMKGLPQITADWFYNDSKGYYRRAPHEPRHIDLFRRYFQTLAEVEGPTVVHCAAGKDRTGLICALTHHLAGVSHDDIMAAYLLTNDESRLDRKMDFLGPWIEKQVGLTVARDALRVAVSVKADYLLTNDESRIARKMNFLGPWLRDTVGKTVDEAGLRVAVSVNAAYLETAFSVIREAHGSLDGYLEEVLGVDAALRERLQARLLA